MRKLMVTIMSFLILMTFVAFDVNTEVQISSECINNHQCLFYLPNIARESLQEIHGDEFTFGLGLDMYMNARLLFSEQESYRMSVFVQTELVMDEGFGLESSIFEELIYYHVLINCFETGELYILMETDLVSDGEAAIARMYYRNGMLYAYSTDAIFDGARTSVLLSDATDEVAVLRDIPREALVTERIRAIEGGYTEITLFLNVTRFPSVRWWLFDMLGWLWGGMIQPYYPGLPLMVVTAVIDENGFPREVTERFGLHVHDRSFERDFEKYEVFRRVEFIQFGDVEIYFPAHIDDFEYVEM